MVTLDARPRLASDTCFHSLIVEQDHAATDLELEKIAATLLPLNSSQLKKIQHKLVPERLRATNRDDSMLLRLPQELRDAIYKLILEDVQCKESGPIVHRAFLDAPPMLFRVCRQLREEIAPLYWKSIATSAYIYTLKQQMAKSEPNHLKLIQRLECDSWSATSKGAAMAVAEGLELNFDMKRGVIWILFPVRSDSMHETWLGQARVNSLGEVEKL